MGTIREALRAGSGPKPLGTVIIQCGYPVVALGLKEILNSEAEVVYEGTGTSSRTGGPALLILCPNGAHDVASEVRRLESRYPDASAVLLFYARVVDRRLAAKALRAGASGLIHAGMRPEQILDAVRRAREGKVAGIPAKLAAKLLAEGENQASDGSALTPRQREILGLVCEGLSNAQIAERLFLTESTVKQHLYAAYRLLNVRNRTQAARLFQGA